MRRQYFEDKFIVPFAPLSEDEGIAQGYTIIKTAEDFESLRDEFGHISASKILLVNNIDIRENHLQGELKDAEFNGNGNTIYTKKCIFKNITYDLSSSIVKNLKVVMETESEYVAGDLSSTNAIGEHLINSLIDNCLIDLSINHTGNVGGITYTCQSNAKVSNCFIRVHQLNNAGKPTAGAVNTVMSSTLDNCFVSFRVDEFTNSLILGVFVFQLQGSTITNCKGIFYKNRELKRNDNYYSWIAPIFVKNSSTVNQVTSQFKII